METFSEKINVSTRSSIEIAGLLKKKKMKKKMKKMKKKMTRIVKSRMSRFSRGVLEANTMLLGIWITRYWLVSDLRLGLKPWASILAEFSGILYADHVRFDPRHPYIYRASTDALISHSPRTSKIMTQLDGILHLVFHWVLPHDLMHLGSYIHVYAEMFICSITIPLE